MTVEIDSDSSEYDEIWKFTEQLASPYKALWQGREITWADAVLCSREIKQSALSLINSWEADDSSFDRLVAQLIWVGTPPEQRALLGREIQYLVTGKDDVFVMQAGFGKSLSKFWHKHKKAILITATAIAVVATIAVVVVATGGTGGASAASAGGALLDALCNEDDDKDRSKKQSSPSRSAALASGNTHVPMGGEMSSLSLEPLSLESSEIFEPLPQNGNPLAPFVFPNNVGEYGSNLPSHNPNEAFPSGELNFLTLPVSMQPKSIQDIEASAPPLTLFQHGRDLPPVMDKKAERSQRFFLDLFGYQEMPDNSTESTMREYFPLPQQEIEQDIPSMSRPIPIPPKEIKIDPSIIEDMKRAAAASPFKYLNPEALKEPSSFYERVTGEPLEVALQKIEEIRRAQQDKFPPFEPQPLPLIGNPDQSTANTHCGINNSYQTVQQGGICLYNSLSKQMAIQPHWVHKDSIFHGLSMVALEKIVSESRKAPPVFGLAPKIFEELGHIILKHSDIQKSIEYELKNLSNMAEEILRQDNPKLKQLHIAFSNSGHVLNETLKQMPQKHRDTVIVIAVGPTTTIDANLGCKVYNVIGDRDWASKICNGGEQGILKARENADIRIISQAETQWLVGGHYFEQPDYQDEIEKIITSEIINNYEIR